MPVLFMWIFLLRIFLRTAEQHRQHAVLRGCVNLHPVRQQIHKREVTVTAHGGIKKLRHIHRACLLCSAHSSICSGSVSAAL